MPYPVIFFIKDKGVIMRRGWQVELKDGTIINEKQSDWKKIPKKDIIRLTLLYDGRRWDLKDKEAYFVRTQASMVPGIQASFQIEKRTVGYYEGATKVFYTVDEFTGVFNMKLEDNSK